jgi:methylamine dehydrogenase accessory protein MauD
MTGWWAASYVVLWIVVVALAVLVLALARQIGTLHLRLGPRGALELDEEGPPLGEAPPAAELATVDGGRVTVGGPGEPQLVLFVSPTCPVCREVAPGLPVAARSGGMAARVVADGDDGSVARMYGSLGAPVAASSDLPQDYGVPGTPYAVVLDALGVVRAKGTVNNLEQMEGLVDTARRRLEAAVG